MKRKNGFIFIETIVVTGILIGCLMIIYTLYVSALNTENRKLRYDDTSKLYQTYYVYKYLDSYYLSTLVNNVISNETYEVIYSGRADVFGSAATQESGFFESLWNELNISEIYIIPTNVSEILECAAGKWTTICSNNNLITYLKTLDDGESNEAYFIVEYSSQINGKACSDTCAEGDSTCTACDNEGSCYYYYAYHKIIT